MKKHSFFITLIILLKCSCMAQAIDSISGLSFKEKELSVCYREDKNRVDIRGVIHVKQNFDGVFLSIYLDCDLGVVPICETKGALELAYKPNTIKINNDEFYIGNTISDTDISLFVPTKLIEVQNRKAHFIVLEVANVSYTSVGGLCAYIVMVLDDNNKLLKHYIHESGMNALSKQEIINLLGKCPLKNLNSQLDSCFVTPIGFESGKINNETTNTGLSDTIWFGKIDAQKIYFTNDKLYIDSCKILCFENVLAYHQSAFMQIKDKKYIYIYPAILSAGYVDEDGNDPGMLVQWNWWNCGVLVTIDKNKNYTIIEGLEYFEPECFCKIPNRVKRNTEKEKKNNKLCVNYEEFIKN